MQLLLCTYDNLRSGFILSIVAASGHATERDIDKTFCPFYIHDASSYDVDAYISENFWLWCVCVRKRVDHLCPWSL